MWSVISNCILKCDGMLKSSKNQNKCDRDSEVIEIQNYHKIKMNTRLHELPDELHKLELYHITLYE